MSPVSLQPFYADSAAMKVPGFFCDAAAGGLVIDAVKIFFSAKIRY